jgi:hypothetical protein
MGNRVRYEKNAPLEVGDKVICIHMDDEFSPVAGGMPGVVKSVATVFGEKQYYVDWRNGSSLALIDGIDQWRKVVIEGDDDEKELNENKIILVKSKKDIINKKIKN